MKYNSTNTKMETNEFVQTTTDEYSNCKCSSNNCDCTKDDCKCSSNNKKYAYTSEITNNINDLLKKEYTPEHTSVHLCCEDKMTDFQKKLDNVLTGLFLFLSTKNKNYGNSALQPVHVFSKTGTEDGILGRMDDKLSRIANSDILRKNDIVDLMGYLAILCINKGWTDFTELID